MNRILPSACVAVLSGLAFAACGGGGGAAPPPKKTLPEGQAAFDVTAALTLSTTAGAGNWDAFPRTHAFTLVWDVTGARVIAGGGAGVSTAAVATDDGKTFRTTEPLSLGVDFDESCGGASAAYDELVFTWDTLDGALHGTAHGHASYQTGDQLYGAGLTATIEGVPDATAPTVKVRASAVDPLVSFLIEVSEPVPPTATLSLRAATSGEIVPLERGLDVSDQAIGFFTKPGVVLRYDETYTIATDGLVDFAGLHAAAAAAPTVKTGAAPPLVPEDGFESVTTPMFGGAGVLHGGPLTPLAGDTSLVLNTGFGGGFGFLPYHLGPTLAVRLAVSPGDTVVRFATQLVAVYDEPEQTFYGTIRVGSVGGAVAEVVNVSAKGFVKTTLPRDGDVYLGPLKSIDVPLPAGAAGEVTFEIVGLTSSCGLPPSPTALIIDDLRVE